MTTINITKEQIIEGVNDTLLTERCSAFVIKSIESGMEINEICMFIKDYQKKYLFIKQEGGDYKAFTMKIWLGLGQRGDGKFTFSDDLFS